MSTFLLGLGTGLVLAAAYPLACDLTDRWAARAEAARVREARMRTMPRRSTVHAFTERRPYDTARLTGPAAVLAAAERILREEGQP